MSCPLWTLKKETNRETRASQLSSGSKRNTSDDVNPGAVMRCVFSWMFAIVCFRAQSLSFFLGPVRAQSVNNDFLWPSVVLRFAMAMLGLSKSWARNNPWGKCEWKNNWYWKQYVERHLSHSEQRQSWEKGGCDELEACTLERNTRNQVRGGQLGEKWSFPIPI